MKDIIAEELNVKEVDIQADEGSLVSYHAKANFKVLGAKLGKSMKEVASKIQEMSSEDIAGILDGVKKTFEYGDNEKIEIGADELMIQREEKANLRILNEGDITIGFDTDVTPELLYEGIARDMIRSIQTMRKENGFEVSDRINVKYNGDEDTLKAVSLFRDKIANETLALALEHDNSLGEEEIKIEKV